MTERARPDAVGLDGTAALAYSRPLDGLRGIAIALVLAVHIASPSLPTDTDLGMLLRRLAGSIGPTGVDLFFVVSGFLITSILLKARESPQALRAFYARRALRIMPAYYVFALIALLLPLVRRRYPALPDPLPTLLFVQNWQLGLTESGIIWPNNILWSVCIEEQFYLFWPLAVYRLSRRGLVRLAVAMIAVSVVSRVLAARWIGPDAAYFLTPCRLDGLALGALAALGCVPRRPTIVLAAAAGTWAFVLFAGNYGLNLGSAVWSAWSACGNTVIALFYFAVLVRFGGTENRVLVHMGRRCYGLYLFHAPAITIATQVFPPYRYLTFLLIASVLLTWGAAELSWRFVEAPALSLKRLFPYRAARSGDAAPVVAPAVGAPAGPQSS